MAQTKSKTKLSPLVALIIPVHNNREDTVAFLESMKQVTYNNYRVIITDDGSTDGTEELVRDKYPDVVLIKGDGSLWWAEAANIGMYKAIEIGADYVLLADNDCVFDSEFLSALVETAEANPRSITTSKTYSYHHPERLLGIGGEVNWLKGGFIYLGSGEIDKGQYDEQRDVNFAWDSILINMSFLGDIGMVDSENFPQYWGDLDLTYRAYKKGYRIIYEPRSLVWHKSGSTVEKAKVHASLPTLGFAGYDPRKRYNVRQMLRFYLRHCPVPMLIPFVLGISLRRLIALFTRR